MNLLLLIFLFTISSAAVFVILAKNPIQSVLFLILVYLLTASLFMLLGAEFLAILVFIIYIGAISILFLFVIMLLNLRAVELHSTFFNYLPVGSFLGLLFFLEIFYIFATNYTIHSNSVFFLTIDNTSWLNLITQKSNLYLFGIILYNYNWFFVIIIAVILLVAMMGPIIFTVDSAKKKDKGYLQDNSKSVANITFWNKSRNRTSTLK
jgi:NADH-quinone oxidoreductase subunit J